FLPQQEYEILVKTQISVKHSATEVESTEIEERLAFVTAGPPGLNEVEAVGEDLRPYVRSAHVGGRGRLYREEPVNLVLEPDMKIFATGEPGEPGVDEHGLRVPATLSVTPVMSASADSEQQNASFESEDWFAAH